VTWDELNLVELEAELLLTGCWRNFDELEDSLSLRELYEILEAFRKRVYDDRVFNAKIHGIQIDNKPKEEAHASLVEAVRERLGKEKQQKASDPNDITRLRGRKAKEMGFGIGFGLDYEVIDGNGVSVPQ
jgi:hypothetical protein